MRNAMNLNHKFMQVGKGIEFREAGSAEDEAPEPKPRLFMRGLEARRGSKAGCAYGRRHREIWMAAPERQSCGEPEVVNLFCSWRGSCFFFFPATVAAAASAWQAKMARTLYEARNGSPLFRGRRAR